MVFNQEGLPQGIWSYDEYFAFALMFAATFDRIVKESEYDAIADEVGDELARKAHQVLETKSPEEATTILLALQERFFPNSILKRKLLTDMEVIFRADGRFCDLEKEAVQKLKENMGEG